MGSIPFRPGRSGGVAAFAGALLVAAASAVSAVAGDGAAPGTPPSPPAKISIEASQILPVDGLTVVKVAGDEAMYFVSPDGRYVIKGRLFDRWAGTEVKTFEEAVASASRVNVAGLDDKWAMLKPFVIGHGPKRIVAFVDPYCPYCAQLLAATPKYVNDYTFVVVPIAILGTKSVLAVRDMNCDPDQVRAMRALTQHRFGELPAAAKECDLSPLAKRVLAQDELKISAVPFLVRPDGTTVSGLPPDLGAWLAGGGGNG
jgi:thiol:disulfide interchange protein DsbC